MEASSLIALGDALGPLLGLWVLRRRAGGWQGFVVMVDAVWFIAAMGILAAGVSAAVGATAAATFGFGRSPVSSDLGLQWWISDMASIVVLTPTAELIRRQN